MFGLKFRKKLRELHRVTGPPPQGDSNGALRRWMGLRAHAANRIFTPRQLTKFLNRDKDLIKEGYIPH